VFHHHRQTFPSDVGCLKSAQALFVLCFSTIMLNTDLHNDGVLKKMSLADFLRNNRGINDGKDVPEDFLSRLYNNIKYDEIQLKADGLSHQNVHSSTIDYDGLVSDFKHEQQHEQHNFFPRVHVVGALFMLRIDVSTLD